MSVLAHIFRLAWRRKMAKFCCFENTRFVASGYCHPSISSSRTKISKGIYRPESRYCNSSLGGQQSAVFFPLFLQFEKFMDRTAVIDRHGQQKYRDILQSSCNLASNLVSKYRSEENLNGLGGARIGLMCDTDTSFCVAVYACWLADAVPVAIPVRTSDKLTFYLKHAGCSIVLLTERNANVVRHVSKALSPVDTMILKKEDYVTKVGSNVKFSDILKIDQDQFTSNYTSTGKSISREFNENKPAILFFTSRDLDDSPKTGVVLTFHNLQCRITSAVNGWQKTDVALFTHHTLWSLFPEFVAAHCCGATCVIHNKYSPNTVLDEVLGKSSRMAIDHPVNKFLSVRSVFLDLLQLIQVDSTGKISKEIKDAHQRVKFSYMGVHSLVPREWFQTTGKKLELVYGSLETGSVMKFQPEAIFLKNRNYFQLKSKLQTGITGRIVLYEEDGCHILYEGIGRKVMKLTSRLRNTEGEFQLKGGNIFTQYWNDLEETKNSFTDDGWYKTGYFAKFDNRHKDINLINPFLRGWTDRDNFVSCGFVYAIIKNHPAVEKCLVLRKPNARYGETVALVAALKPGTSLTLKEVRRFCAEAMPIDGERKNSHLYPSLLLILDSIPVDKFHSPDYYSLLSILTHKSLHRYYNIQVYPDTLNS